MGYTITKETARWAGTRSNQLQEAENHIGYAIEMLEKVPEALKQGAVLMEDQPENDLFLSFAGDIETLLLDLKQSFSSMTNDRKALDRALRKFEKGE